MSGLSAGQAKQILMHELEDELRHESARLIRQVEEETRQRRRQARSQHPRRGDAAGGVEPRRRDDRVGRGAEVGRAEGPHHRPRGPQHPRARDAHRDRLHHRRHARSGAAVRLRRRPPRDRAAHARAAAPGRPHPPGPHRGGLPPGEVGDRPARGRGGGAGGVRGQRRLAPPRAREAARPAASFRTSYGQNVLHHSIECARLAAMLAAELGADPRVAARAALLHDIGKAVSHETDGPHALVGGELARRYKESEARGARDGGAPQRGGAADRRGRDRPDRGRALGRAARRARRVARAVREAAARAGGDRLPATRAWTRSTRCTPAARSA